MRPVVAFLLTLTVFVALSAIAAKAPDKIVFETKMGNVTFNHKAHVDRAGGKCETCHDKLFPQSRKPINFKQGMHKPAEKAQKSCGACHHPGGKAFETKGNCKKCHVRK